jgi:hypothetical protein
MKNRRLNEHHGKDWNPKLLDMSLNTFLDKLKSVDKRGYDSIESIIEKHKNKMIKENRLVEYGGYDDPSMYAKHAGAYMGELKQAYNDMSQILNHLDKLSGEILDDTMRKDLEVFLRGIVDPMNKLSKTITATEKKHLGALRGGRPTPRSQEGED